jgi:hypothetical protein
VNFVKDSIVLVGRRDAGGVRGRVRRPPGRRHDRPQGHARGHAAGEGHLVLVYALSYMTEVLEFPRNDTLVALVCASVLRLAALAPAGRLSDRIGRREVLMFGTAAMACGRRCSSR